MCRCKQRREQLVHIAQSIAIRDGRTVRENAAALVETVRADVSDFAARAQMIRRRVAWPR